MKTVLSTFEQTDNALSVVELVKRLDKKMNKTTVYRILERLENDGRLHSFLGKDGLRWYARCEDCSSTHHTDTHPHFQCRNCGQISCLSINVSIPSVPNHKIDSAELLLIGQCERCLS